MHPTLLRVVAAAFLVGAAGCGPDAPLDLRSSEAADAEGGAPDFDLTASDGYLPKIGAVPWPSIHQNDRGTKEGQGVGPVQPTTTDRYRGVESILFTVGNRYLYHQGAFDTKIRMFDKNNLGKGPLRTADLGAFWPIAGGGNIDQVGSSWWTGGPVVIRLSEDLSKATYSDDLLSVLPAGATAPKHFNSVNFLADGTVLVSTMQEWAFLVDPIPGPNGKFPVRSAISKLAFTYRGEQIIKATDSYGPRPMLDGEGGIYFASSGALARVTYDATTRAFRSEAEWMFRNPQNVAGETSNMAVSNPVIIGALVCVSTDPLQEDVYQEVYCLNRQTGALVYKLRPFDKPGISAAHTLGGIEATQELFVIADDDSGKGGVAGYNLKTGEKLWPNVALNQVSDAFVLANGNRRLYISAKATKGTVDLNAIDLNTGKTTVIETVFSLSAPTAALGALDSSGNLFYPFLSGLTRYKD